MNWDWDKLQEKRQKQNWGQHPGDQRRNDEPRGPQRGPDEEPPLGGRTDGPDFKKVSESLRKIPQLTGPLGGKGKWIAIVLVGAWLLSGIYIVQPDEQGWFCVLDDTSAPWSRGRIMLSRSLLKAFTDPR